MTLRQRLGSTRVDPLTDRMFTAGSVDDGSPEMVLGRQGMELWFRSGGVAKVHHWPGPGVAPVATVEAVNTGYYFQFPGAVTDITVEWPWRMATLFDQLTWTAYVACDPQLAGNLFVRAETSDLVSTVTDAESPWVPLSGATDLTRASGWFGSPLPVYPCSGRLSPTLPAGRDFALSFAVQRQSASGNDTLSAAYELPVYLYSLLLRDSLQDG